MKDSSGNMAGLLVVGAVLVVAAITIASSMSDSSTEDATGGSAASSSESIVNGGDGMSTSTGSKGAVDHADASTFQSKVLNAQGRVLVDFYADWCGPCRMVGPVLEQIAQEHAGAQIVKVNVDNAASLATEYGIQSIPALLVFENGRVVDQHVGVASKARILAMLGI
jgi:thioredoxin 1